MEGLTQHLIAFIIGVLSSLAAILVLRYRVLLRILPAHSKKGYLIDLVDKIKAMPFIYKDLEGEVMNDFVDVELQSIDLGTLSLRPTSHRLNVEDNERLRRYYKVLFLGNAGIGKTTFQRHSIITLIAHRKKAKFVYDKESRTPIYLPLKAVDNSGSFPILKYILRHNRLFSHGRGLRKLTRLAKQERLFLFLDGYDEIPFTGGDHNFVQEELGLILFPQSQGGSKIENNSYLDFYRALGGCRVWLSSRKEFFEQNPLGSVGSGQRIQSAELMAVELRGIGNNRINLAKTIFEKYRQRSKLYSEILSEEYFLYDIDSSNDEELKRLSFNPLFLTVMCYIYVQKAIEANHYKTSWANTFEELILECIELLLQDLDDVKARDLPEAHRAALLTRRNAFYEEKKIFLQYFASQLFFDGMAIFTLEYLKSKIKWFFQNEHCTHRSQNIIQDLHEDKTSQPNFALQLIYCGVFIIVDKSKEGTLYDFPHRRFREVLASRYIAEPERYELLLANMEKKQFSEFLRVFLGSTGFKNLQFQDDSLRSILDKARGHSSDYYYRTVTRQFIANKPDGYSPDRIIQRFLNECLDSTDPSFMLSIEILNSFNPDNVFRERLPSLFRLSLDERTPRRLALCCSLLEYYDKVLLKELIRNSLSSYIHDRSTVPVLFQYACRLDSVFVLSQLREILSHSEPFTDFCYALTFNLLHMSDAELTEYTSNTLCEVFKILSRAQAIRLFYFFHLFCPALYQSLKEALTFDVHQELFIYASLVDKTSTSKPLEREENPNCHIPTNDVVYRFLSQISRLTLPVAFSKTFKEKDKFINKFIPIMDPPRTFKQEVTSFLERTKYQVFSAHSFPSETESVLSRAINGLIDRKGGFQDKKNLPERLRDPDGTFEARVVSIDGFEAQLLNQILSGSRFEYQVVLDVQDVVDQTSYDPPHLVNLFS